MFIVTELSNKNLVTHLLKKAGINLNGKNPSDIHISNPKFYSRLLSGGSLALGESYMDGWWSSKNIDQFIYKLLKYNLEKKVRSFKIIINVIKAKLINLQSIKRAFIVGKAHYDVGNDLYKLMLDENMIYSCAYWKKAKTLKQAQIDKLDLICKKLKLKPGMTLLDVGCGWGGLAKFAAEKYKVKVTGITISKEQYKYATELCKDLPVKILIKDYRKINQKFDRIVSVGMFEHVGYKNYKTFMKTMANNLKPDGLFLLHTIGSNSSGIVTDPWIDKYIFPNGVLPSYKRIANAAHKKFIIEDWHNFGLDYDKTLMAWYNNFIQNKDKLTEKYSDTFIRMWTYYLLASAASFRARKNHVWQIVFSKDSLTIPYDGVR